MLESRLFCKWQGSGIESSSEVSHTLHGLKGDPSLFFFLLDFINRRDIGIYKL